MNSRSIVRILSTAVATLIAASTFVMSQAKVATTAGQFLGIAIGPKAMAMGSAFVAQNTDASVLYWNPGAAAQLEGSQVAFSNSEWLAGTQFRWFGTTLKLDDVQTFGLSVTQLNYGEEEVTTVESPDGTQQYWSANDLAVGLTYSRKFTDRFSLGGTVKVINQSIWNETATSYAFDIGLLFVTEFHGMRLGMSISNFGSDLALDGRDLLNRIDPDPDHSGSNKTLVGKLKTDAWPIPLLFRVGVGMDVVQTESMLATVTLDALRPNDNNESVNVGAELGFLNVVYLRGGYKSLFGKTEAYGSTVSLEGLSAGVGVRLNAEGLGTLRVDYAANKFAFFGTLNTIAVSLSF